MKVETRIGLTPEGELHNPPSSPNCVYSKAQNFYSKIKPLPVSHDDNDINNEKIKSLHPLNIIKLVLQETKRCEIVVYNNNENCEQQQQQEEQQQQQQQQQQNYIHSVFTTRLMKYKDDVEFLYLPQEPNCLHVRSASRVGWSDNGCNRRRVEMLRKKYEKKMKELEKDFE
eukprot:Pgem_evm1s19517